MDNSQNAYLSLYQQVENRIRAEIAKGTWKEGDLIPSEHALASKYDVSQGTVRKAVLNLTQTGLLYRKQGKGTFVVDPRFDRGRYHNFRFVNGLTSELVNIKLNLTDIQVIPSNADIAEYLKLRKGTKVIVLERKGKIGSENYLHSLSYLPQKIHKGLEKYTKEDFIQNTLWKIQEMKFGVRVEKREEFISTVTPCEEIGRHLEVEPKTPVLRIEAKMISYTGDVVEYRISHCHLGELKFYVSS